MVEERVGVKKDISGAFRKERKITIVMSLKGEKHASIHMCFRTLVPYHFSFKSYLSKTQFEYQFMTQPYTTKTVLVLVFWSEGKNVYLNEFTHRFDPFN